MKWSKWISHLLPPISDYRHCWKTEVISVRSYCVSLRTPVRSGRGATSTVYVVDGFLIDWLCCRAASASQQLQLQRQQSYWCYWAAVKYNPIYTWHEARLEQITPNPIRWKGAQLTEPLTFTWLQFFFAGLLPGGGWGNNVKITINDLDFSRHWTVSWVQSCESYLLLFMRSSLSPPLPDSLTHPLCLFILLPFSFLFSPHHLLLLSFPVFALLHRGTAEKLFISHISQPSYNQ